MQLFADRISSQMSMVDGVVYSIEGPRSDLPPAILMGHSRFVRGQVNARRSRTNYLTAYDATSGKLLWSLPPLTGCFRGQEDGQSENCG